MTEENRFIIFPHPSRNPRLASSKDRAWSPHEEFPDLTNQVSGLRSFQLESRPRDYPGCDLDSQSGDPPQSPAELPAVGRGSFKAVGPWSVLNSL
jgi:hypothetical protein